MVEGNIITNDGGKDGLKFLDDTGDYRVPNVNVIQGINQTIVMQNGFQYRRDITIECRSAKVRGDLMVALGYEEGVVINNGYGVANSGVPYVVIGVTPVESFGIGDANSIQTWTFRVELILA